MKKFFKNISFFLLGLIIIFVINFSVNYLIIKNSEIKLKSSKMLIIGDSHTRRSINPILLNNAQNISQNAEPYIITYWKLKTVVKKVDPDTVLIGFAPHNISDFNDLKFSDKTWSHEMFERIYLIQDFKSINNINIDYESYYTFLFKRYCLFPRLNHILFLGGYTNSNKSDISNINKTIERHFHFNNRSSNISQLSIKYLDSIIDLCISNNIVPILINTPVHTSYKENIPEKIQIEFNLEKEKYKKNNIKIIESNSKEYRDSLFFNSDHLNNYGSEIFTKKLIERFKSN